MSIIVSSPHVRRHSLDGSICRLRACATGNCSPIWKPPTVVVTVVVDRQRDLETGVGSQPRVCARFVILRLASENRRWEMTIIDALGSVIDRSDFSIMAENWDLNCTLMVHSRPWVALRRRRSIIDALKQTLCSLLTFHYEIMPPNWFEMERSPKCESLISNRNSLRFRWVWLPFKL